MEVTFQKYRRKGWVEMRPYTPGEDLTGISVSEPDKGATRGMIARNPDNHNDQWFVAMDFFSKNYEKDE